MERIVVKSLEQARALLPKLNWGEFSLDTETTSIKQTDLELTGISLCDGKYNIYIPIPNKDLLMVTSIINDNLFRESKIIAHNWVFDARVMHKYGVDLSKYKRFDTMIAHHLIDENSRHGLKHLTRTILDKEVADYDDSLSHFSDEFYEYALDDSLNTWELYRILLPRIFDEKLDKLFFNIEMPFQNVLLEMAIEGVLIDVKLLKSQQKILKEEIRRLEVNLYEMIGAPYKATINEEGEIITESNVNLNSSKQLIKIFNDLGIPITEKTKKGNPSVGKETLDKNKDNPFVKELIKYKIATKLYNGFISEKGQIVTNLERDNKVRPYFSATGTKTGRLSCSSPNLQQLPKPKDYSPVKVRELFIAPKGYKMFSCDYSGQEICVAAQQSKDKALVEALNKGWDSHLAVANKFYNLGLSEEELYDGSEKHSIAKKKYSKERGMAKTINFGLMYGKGAYGFSKDFGVSEEEGQKIVDDYFRGMPMLKRAIDKAHEEIVRTGKLRSMAGRIRHFNITSDSDEWFVERCKRQSFNFLIQGFSADMIRAAAINVYRRKKKHPEYDLKAIMQVHDEMVFIVKEEYVNEATKLVKDAFEYVGKKFIIPIKADIEVGTNYGNAK